MGALLLTAAVITAAVGVMMSPHGDAVADGVEHVRPAIVGMMEKGAIWTLILCALSAWLLFPTRRPKWPARDWALVALLVLLAGSSVYTLVWLYTSVVH